MYNTSGRNTSNGDPLTRDSRAATDLPQRCQRTPISTPGFILIIWSSVVDDGPSRGGAGAPAPAGPGRAAIRKRGYFRSPNQERGSGPGWSPLWPGPYPHGVGPPPSNREPPDLGRHRTVLVSAPGCDLNALLLSSLPLNLADRGCLVRRLASADRAPSPSDRRSSSSRMGRTFVVPDTRPRPCVGCLGVSLRAADL